MNTMIMYDKGKRDPRLITVIRHPLAGIPIGRAGVCEDVARAVAFLASEYDGFITGATLDINGGVYMA